MSPVLKLTPRINLLPIIHGSGEFALAVRRVMMEEPFDCLAVPLPPSFQRDVERAIEFLPSPSLVTQAEQGQYRTEWSPESDADDDDEDDQERRLSYVPIDPCQGVIAGLRAAISEHIVRAFIDLETREYEPAAAVLPDAYALKKVTLDKFAAALLPAIPRPTGQQHQARIVHMARRLRELERKHKSILCICSVLDWPWLREAYQENTSPILSDNEVEETICYQPEEQTLLFLLGELPFITSLYERARAELEEDENLSIDGVKELLLAARESYLSEMKRRARKITPHLLRQCLKYIRNLALLESRFTPDLYTLVIAAKQVCGDQFALHVAETAREYAVSRSIAPTYERVKLGIDRARLPDGEMVRLVSRLPGPPMVWRSLELQRRPERKEKEQWEMRWNPYSQCSWPPEDEKIEDFRAHVFDRAKAVLGADLARTEKFTTSIMDGIDIRDTLRHWYDGDIYVKVMPPSSGKLDCVVMLFDTPADPREYPWRSTWYAEHEEESTLAFYATDFTREMVGPGIALATYGGAMFLFPPVHIPDIWRDADLDFTETLEERLVAAACLHSQCPHVALVSPLPPGPAFANWRSILAKSLSI
ncbi:MAG: hypothetical protein K8R36_23815, partial [Planctomycetales bacterium]|nr:hypothetical protein [Planctomycetales bacterium]